MKVIYTSIFLRAFLLVSCGNAKLNREQFILNPNLLNAYKNYDESLNKARSELLYSNGEIAKNCLMYFQLMSKDKLDESIYNQVIKSEYLECDALKILSYASDEGIKNKIAQGEMLAERLDLSSFPSSLFRMVEKERNTLAALFPKKVSFTSHAAMLDTEDWFFQLEIVGVLNINNNNVPDWIIWLSDESKSGNYRSYTTLVVYDAGDQKKYTATSYPWKL